MELTGERVSLDDVLACDVTKQGDVVDAAIQDEATLVLRYLPPWRLRNTCPTVSGRAITESAPVATRLAACPPATHLRASSLTAIYRNCSAMLSTSPFGRYFSWYSVTNAWAVANILRLWASRRANMLACSQGSAADSRLHWYG